MVRKEIAKEIVNMVLRPIFARVNSSKIKLEMQILHQIHSDFDKYLTTQSYDMSPIELYRPINYVLSIGGKRLRPAIVLLSCYLFKGSYEEALPAAYAIEVFHNFTLLHDDIMDNAPLRRGQPTVHEKFGMNAGILSGDVMLVHAYDALLHLKDQTKVNLVMKVFTKQAIEVCQGQQMDMNFEIQKNVSIDEYLKMIELKTSVLLASAMQMGAILGGADDKNANMIYQFGLHLGIAFQLQDDLLDTFGDPKKFGKKVGGDIAQNKKTILYLKALEHADASQKSQLKRLYNGTEIDENEKISAVVQLFNQLNIKSKTQQLQDDYRQKAFSYLSELEVPGHRMKILEQFAYALMKREV